MNDLLLNKLRLRRLDGTPAAHDMMEAAARIEALEARIAQLEGALSDYVRYMDSGEDGGDGVFEEKMERFTTQFRAALAAGKGE